MPVAVVTEASKRFDLKTLPAVGDEEGGYVIVRYMTWGQSLYRKQIAAKFLIDMDKKKSSAKGEVKTMEEAVSEWEFATLIEQHNLMDAEGRLLNFTNPVDVRKVRGKVGAEITRCIEELNNFEDEVEEGNSQDGSEPS